MNATKKTNELTDHELISMLYVLLVEIESKRKLFNELAKEAEKRGLL